MRALLSWIFVLALFGATTACGDDSRGPDPAPLRAELQSALEASEWNEVLSLAKRALALHGDDAEVLLAAAQAALALDRQSESLKFVARAGALKPKGAVASDLDTVAGIALMYRARELGDDAAWLEANSRLLSGVEGGTLVADAAYSLVLLQEVGGRSNESRQRTYAKKLFALEPDSEKSKKLRSYLEAKGVWP